MRSKWMFAIGLILLGLACPAHAQLTPAAAQNPSASTSITLGTPVRLTSSDETPKFRPIANTIARGQIPDPPAPPAFPGSGPPPVAIVPNNADIYNKGVVNSDADLGGFWSRVGDKFSRCWDDIRGGASGAFQSSPQRAMFQSDRCFEVFSSPISNPFFFEDPRALTEVRPIFIWQHTPNANPIWGGGNNFDYTIRGSVAITEHISFVINRLGFTTIQPKNPVPGITSNTGFSEVMFGPKLTFLRSETSNTVAAVGLTFDIPAGNANVLQDTGHVMLIPYFSIAQNFGKSSYGSFNFMNTTGYTFRTDNTRSEAFYSSFHLDYEIAKRVWPTLELNWRHYTRNGGARPLFFEGMDLANFGSTNTSGHDDLNLAIGTRVAITTNIYWGIAAEFNVLSNGDGRHLDQFRLTTDLIFRY